MLTQIDVVYENELGEQALALPILGVTPKDSLLIRKVTGLNPPNADLFIGDFARDGGTYQGRRIGERNVNMFIDLNPNPALGETISGLRDLLYKTFMDPLVDADHIELVLRSDDGKVRNLYGYTEKFDTEIFDVETLAQISVLCPDPYIRDLSETLLNNPTGTWTQVLFTYGGTAETGFSAEIIITADTPTVTIKNNNLTMVINHAFLATQYLYVNTSRGSRDIRLAVASDVTAKKTANPTWTIDEIWNGKVSGSTTLPGLVADNKTTPLLAKLTTASRWIELHSQGNTFKVYGATEANVVAGVKNLAYRASYWGV